MVEKPKTVLCKTYKDFDEFCKTYIDDADNVCYDVETNAVEVHLKAHRVIGFSLAGSSEVGCYVPIKSLNYTLNLNDKKLVEARLYDILNTKNIIVYHCMHELPVTYNWLNLNIKHIDDVFVKVKLMMGNSERYKGGGGLKLQAVECLGYDDWSESLSTFFSLFSDLKNLKVEMINFLKQYYSNIEQLKYIYKNLVEAYDSLSKTQLRGVVSYEYAPLEIIAEYGALDSSILHNLNSYYNTLMDSTGLELGIDLHKGYEYWMKHHYCGYILETNGAYWNEPESKKIDAWCIDGMKSSILALFNSNLVNDYLKDKFELEFVGVLLELFTDKITPKGCTPVRKTKKTLIVTVESSDLELELNNRSIYPNKKGEYSLNLKVLNSILDKDNEVIKNIYNKWFNNFKIKVNSLDTTIVDFKKNYFNPSATSDAFKSLVGGIIITDEVIAFKLYKDFITLTENINFNVNNYYSNDKELLSIIIELKNDYELTLPNRVEQIFKTIERLGGVSVFSSYSVKKVINESMTYTLTSLQAEELGVIYDYFLMSGIDVEDKSTWTANFEWFFNFRFYKKFEKIQSTYINGKVGRSSVYSVDKKQYESGEFFTRRDTNYFDLVEDGDVSDKLNTFDLMLQQSFSVNTALSGRWQAGIHNIPAGDGVKNIYTSRYKGGCIGMPDGSQIEVRVLATESGDKNLLQAFKDGLDIHRYFASLVLEKPQDEVTKDERSLIKSVVFGILYGETEQTLADEYFNGELKKATDVFNSMFNAFPGIKGYIDRAHKQCKDFNKVTALTQNFINIDLKDPKKNQAAQLRVAQNAPIQSAAEIIAGCIMWELQKYIEDNNLKSKIFCFIHDSIEIDFHPDEVFKLVDKIDYLFNVYPMETFGVPIACDVPIGPSMGQECEILDMQHDEDYKVITITLDGYIQDMCELVKIWKTVYKTVSITNTYEDSRSSEYIPYGDVFKKKKSKISQHMGKTRLKGKLEIYVEV